MIKDIEKAIAKRYAVLFGALAAVFVAILILSDAGGKMFANIIAVLFMFALIPFIIMFMIRKQKNKR